MRIATITAVIASVALTMGCGDGKSPVGSTPFGSGIASLEVSGSVTDFFQRPIAGARVEIVAGTGVGLTTLTNDNGAFLFDLPSRPEAVTLRVTKDGFKDATVNVRDASAAVQISMTPLEAAVLSGSYTVTITADSACDQIPDALRTRTYNATIARDSGSIFSVALSGATLVANSDVFWATESGTDVHFYLSSLYAMNAWLDDLPIVDQVGSDQYLAVDGSTSVIPITQGPIDTTFEGSIAYCLADERAAPYYNKCARLCTSKRHRLTLTPVRP